MNTRQTGNSIMDLQNMLRTIAKADKRITMPLPNGVFDAETEAAVRDFQKAHGLPQNGVVDLDTWNAVRRAYREFAPLVLPLPPLELRWEPMQIISPGSRNAHLYLVQAMLHALEDYYENALPVDVTGVHDDKSVAAVKWLQRTAGLPETGAVDQKTWQALGCLYRMTTGMGCTKDALEKQTIG